MARRILHSMASRLRRRVERAARACMLTWRGQKSAIKTQQIRSQRARLGMVWEPAEQQREEKEEENEQQQQAVDVEERWGGTPGGALARSKGRQKRTEARSCGKL